MAHGRKAAAAKQVDEVVMAYAPSSASRKSYPRGLTHFLLE